MLKRLLSAISLAVVVLAAQAASAGVTIHYEGTAKDLPSARRAIEAARAEARKLGWVVQDANQATVTILRVIGEAQKPYTGPLTGVVIRPHPNCDPLFLQFGSDLYLQDFVKTQFAGPDIHIAIVGLLKTLQPFFRTLSVEDEGEYWNSRNRKALTEHMNFVNNLIADRKRANPSARGPVRITGDRMVDLIE
jgi:hypothetical protein